MLSQKKQFAIYVLDYEEWLHEKTAATNLKSTGAQVLLNLTPPTLLSPHGSFNTRVGEGLGKNLINVDTNCVIL
jgi:hypothetical protein